MEHLFRLSGSTTFKISFAISRVVHRGRNAHLSPAFLIELTLLGEGGHALLEAGPSTVRSAGAASLIASSGGNSWSAEIFRTWTQRNGEKKIKLSAMAEAFRVFSTTATWTIHFAVTTRARPAQPTRPSARSSTAVVLLHARATPTVPCSTPLRRPAQPSHPTTQGRFVFSAYFSRSGSSMTGKRRSVDAIASRAATTSPVVSSIARPMDMLSPGRS